MNHQEPVVSILLLGGGITFFACTLFTIVFLIVLKRFVFSQDKELYSRLEMNKLFFLWTAEYKKFIFENGYKTYHLRNIRMLARSLRLFAVIATHGIIISLVTMIVDIVYQYFIR